MRVALAKWLNIESAKQADKFVFCVDQTHQHWLSKYLKAAARRDTAMPK